MAFHQPTRQSVQRVIRSINDGRDASSTQNHAQERPALDESQTWVLFSPPTDAPTSASYFSDADDVEESAPTPGRSRISDLGSFNTVGRSNQDLLSRRSAVLSSAIDDESIEDDGELDSLDNHLPEFRTETSAFENPASGLQEAAPVFPSHDGLGSFRLDRHVGPEVQDHIYAFERFNPRRTVRRRESIEPVDLEAQQREEQQAHKIQRIEAWRLDQSRVLLQEIHKETRRHARSTRASSSSYTAGQDEVGRVPMSSGAGEHDEHESMDWLEEPSSDSREDDGFLARITRTVIRDLMGLDERLLSILLGESLPEEDDLSSTPTASHPAMALPTAVTEDDSSWQLRIIERVARELGLMVNQMSPHPGAFSTYKRVQHMPLPYAGLPVIPETAPDAAREQTVNQASTNLPEFRPTMPSQQAKPLDIPGTKGSSEMPSPLKAMYDEAEHAGPTPFTQQEWEKDLDIKLVFRYLRNRFTSRSSSAPTFSSGTSHLATCSTQDMAAKAARVRQHHPLVSRTRVPAERRTFKATAPSSPVAMRHPSSCASQSSRRSARRSSASSRHYWDIGGSLGTGSVVAPAGPMGSWGEV